MVDQQSNQNNRVPARRNKYYVLVYVLLICLSLLIIVPCMIIGYAAEYNNAIKYKNIRESRCYGGKVISGYQILPQIYNSTLTYYPARFEFQTLEVDTNRSVRMTYPTYFERTFAFSCVFHSSKQSRNPCDKLVGDVITKYNELLATPEFPCYISDELQIIGLAGEQSIIRKYYQLTTVGIVFIALDISIFLYAAGDALGLGLHHTQG